MFASSIRCIGLECQSPEDWMKIGGWEQYMTSCKDIKMFVWLIAVCLRDKFDYLIREVQSLADTYDLVFDESDSEESEIETITVAKNKNRKLSQILSNTMIRKDF